MKPQPVESVAGTTMRAVAGAMIVLGAIAFVVRADARRGRDRMAGLSRQFAVLPRRRAGRGGRIRGVLSDAGEVGRLDAVSARRGVRAVSVGGIFSVLRIVLRPQPDFPVGDASDSAEGRMAEHSVSLRARWNRARRNGCGELRVHSRLARRRCTSVDGRDRRNRVAAAFDTVSGSAGRGSVRGRLHADLVRSGDVAGAGVAQHAFRLVLFRRRFLERIGRDGSGGDRAARPLGRAQPLHRILSSCTTSARWSSRSRCSGFTWCSRSTS